jgi:1-acyl-sn-glycerol-3-phosphate acyltransferase
MNRLINFVRAVLHTTLMAVTVVPWALVAVLLRLLGLEKWCYAVCINWLRLSVNSGTAILGIRNRITGWENLPTGETAAAILLVKHQSLWETFTMIAIMPHPLAYVFKKELLRIPFFGWAIGSLDMIHIDRKQGAQAFSKVVEQGRRLLAKGTWVIMFPEGTRTARGGQGVYKTGGTRLAIETGAPVVPVAVTSARCWPKKAFIKTPGTVDISIGKPIPSIGREPAELMREVETWIEAEMRRLDAEAYK